MVAKATGYFGRPFKGYRGVTQGDPLSPTIFNVVVDAVIRHWVKVVTPTEAVMGGLGMIIIDLASYFYAEDGLVLSAQPERLQRFFEILTGLFGRVGLQKKQHRRLAWYARHDTLQVGCQRRSTRDRQQRRDQRFWSASGGWQNDHSAKLK